MINDIYNIVHFIINKESRGYITPFQFNSFAKQAQQEIVDGYFYEYNKSIANRNSRVDYREVLKKIKESMDVFVMPPTTLIYNTVSGLFSSPPDFYTTITLMYNGKEIDEVSREKLTYHMQDDFSGNNIFYPTYVKYGNEYQVMPSTITSEVKLIYFRNPKDPNWTYQLLGDDAIFNPSAPGYQDLEVGVDDKFKMITKILKYAGLNIREADVVQAAVTLDQLNNAEQKQ
jgi:hypothetical protein